MPKVRALSALFKLDLTEKKGKCRRLRDFLEGSGVPDEFQLEHPPDGPEDPRNPAPELHFCVGSTEYRPDSARISGLMVYPYSVLNRVCWVDFASR